MKTPAYTPISRNNLFYSEEDFDLETGLVEDYMEEDTNQTVVVYEVDREKTNVSNIYKEALSDGIVFKMPKEIPCHYEIQDSQLKSYDSKTSNAVYSIGGNLTVYVLDRVLEKYGCEIGRGDYIGVLIDNGRMVHYVVTDDGKVNTSNKLYVGAYKTAFRIVKATIVADDEFNGGGKNG